MSEHAFRSRGVTTTSDPQRAMREQLKTELRASAKRAPDERRRDERTCISFARRDEDDGSTARDERAAQKDRQTARSGDLNSRRSPDALASRLGGNACPQRGT